MDPNQALKQAAVVCREAARLGLADQGTLRDLYQEYQTFLQRGVRASFPQLLLSRRVIDPRGAELLRQAVLESSSPGAMDPRTSRASGVVQLGTQGLDPGALSLAPSPLAQDPVTDPYGAVLPTPAPGHKNAEHKGTAPFNTVLANQTPELAFSDDGEDDDLEIALPDELELASPDPPLEVSFGTQGSSGSDRFDPGGGVQSLGTTFAVLDSDEIGSTADSKGEDLAVPDPTSALFMSAESEEEEEHVDPPTVGDVVGKYTLTGMIGRGGMGVIYKAIKEGSDEPYALKVLLGAQDAGADRRRQRFRREVEAMRRLEHENIVGVFDYGRHGPFDWYTMDYVEGKDFEKLLEQGEMESAEKMRVFMDICAAMSHAHERNVIHRDLKPQNVLVDRRTGRGHVLDFGLAKILDQGVGMTRTGSALGTPFYMAPEQLKSAKHIDARADVFSLGVILYEISTGTRPFLGNTAAEVGNKILTIEPPKPTVIKPDLHPDIDAMVLKALEKDANRRYADAGEFFEDLKRHRKGLGVEGASGLEGAKRDIRRFVEKNRVALTAVLGTALVTTLVIVGVIGVFFGDDEGSRRPRVSSKSKTDSGKSDDEDSGGSGKTSKPDDSSGKTQDPKPSPSKTREPEPSPSKTSDPDPSPSREPSPRPSASEVPQPSPKKTPRRARTPIELARVKLAPDREGETAGADDLVAKNGERQQATLILELMQGLIPAMAIGDLDLAERDLKELTSNPDFQLGSFKEEVEHDIETLRDLRELAGLVLRELERPLRRVGIYGGEQLDLSGDLQVLNKSGYVRAQLRGDYWLELDPCALRLRDLSDVVISRDKDVDNASAHYGLAVLGIYRGLNERDLDQHLTEALRTNDEQIKIGRNAVKRRRRLADFLSRAMLESWRAFEDEAGNRWRKEEKLARKPKRHVDALEDFVAEFGRTETYLRRRADWIRFMSQHLQLSDLLKGKGRSGGREVRYRFKEGEPTDFVLRPLEDEGDRPRPFRAERQSRALAVENASLTLELRDLISTEATFELASKGSELIRVEHSGMVQEIDPDAGWKVLYQGRPLKGLADTKERKFAKEKEIIFKRSEEDQARVFMIRHPQDKLSAPFSTFKRAPRDPSMGVSCLADLRIREVILEWQGKENAKDAQELREALTERRLLAVEAEKGQQDGFVLARDQRERLAGFVLKGEWKPGRDGLACEPTGQLWTSQFGDYGVLRFEIAFGDGPGARLHLRDSHRGTSGPTWRLPAFFNTDANRFREVLCVFNLDAKTATVLVDGIRLETFSKKGIPRKAFFGVEFLGRTQGKIRNLRLIQFRPRELR